MTTSQFVTAPKHRAVVLLGVVRLTTSQFVTAPTLFVRSYFIYVGLTTSQFVTAPKPLAAVLAAHQV